MLPDSVNVMSRLKTILHNVMTAYFSANIDFNSLEQSYRYFQTQVNTYIYYNKIKLSLMPISASKDTDRHRPG